MPNQLYKIPRVTDAQIDHALTKLGQEFGQFDISINVMQQGLGSVRFPDSKESVAWQQVLGLNGELVDHFGGSLGGASIYYYRGGQVNDPVQKSPVLDDLVIDLNGLDETRMRVASRALAIFRPVSLPKSGKINDQIVAQQALQESTFARLEKQLEDLFEQTIGVRKELDEAVRHKTAALEEAFSAKQEEADGKLREREEELDRRARELDDSDNTFARRKIRDGMLTDVTERVKNFDVSTVTRSARKPVARGMLGLIYVFLALMAWTGYELYSAREVQSSIGSIAASLKQHAAQAVPASASAPKPANLELAATMLHDSSTERITLWVRFSLLTIGLVGSIIYYIRWQSRWAEQFAATENSLKQFHLDVSRANWVVETCLEWRKETESLIPTPLIESLTRGLFTRDTPTPQAIHPADELASALVGSASKISLAVGDTRIEYDKPGKIPKSVPVTKPVD
jgi:hypothetical protein